MDNVTEQIFLSENTTLLFTQLPMLFTVFTGISLIFIDAAFLGFAADAEIM